MVGILQFPCMISFGKATLAGRTLRVDGVDLCSRHQRSNVQILFSNSMRAASAFHPLGQWTEVCVVYFRRFLYEPFRSSRQLIEDFLPQFPRALTFIPASLEHLVHKIRVLGKEKERWYFFHF